MILIFWQYGAFGKTMCYLGFLWLPNALIFLSYRGAVCGDRAVMFLLEDDYLNHPEMLAEVVRPGRKVTANKCCVHVIFFVILLYSVRGIFVLMTSRQTVVCVKALVGVVLGALQTASTPSPKVLDNF